MIQYVIKVALTAVLVVAVTEIAKRSPLWASILASLPVTSLLAFIWLYLDTGSAVNVAVLARGIFWLVLPSLVLFLLLPVLLGSGLPFWLSLGVSCAGTVAAYFFMIWLLPRFGISL
ncbi:MAG: DUF3147 family protein [Pseudomonadales bacterium]